MSEQERIHSPELLEEERKLAAAHAETISKAALEVEKILIAHNLTMDDLGEMVSIFNDRAQSVFSKMKISNIKDIYDRRN